VADLQRWLDYKFNGESESGGERVLKIGQHLAKLEEDHSAGKTHSNCTQIFSFGRLCSTRIKSGNRRPFRQLEKPSLEVAPATLV